MELPEAQSKLEAVLDELADAGFAVWGFDDESIQIGSSDSPGVEIEPRYPPGHPWREQGSPFRRAQQGT